MASAGLDLTFEDEDDSAWPASYVTRCDVTGRKLGPVDMSSLAHELVRQVRSRLLSVSSSVSLPGPDSDILPSSLLLLLLLLLPTTQPTWSTLVLADNSLCESGARVLSDALAVNTTVTDLDVSQCSVGDEGLASLVAAMMENPTVLR